MGVYCALWKAFKYPIAPAMEYQHTHEPIQLGLSYRNSHSSYHSEVYALALALSTAACSLR